MINTGDEMSRRLPWNHRGDYQLRSELEGRAIILVVAAIKGRGKLYCGARGGGLSIINDAMQALETAEISPEKAGIKSIDVRAAVSREIRPRVDKLREKLAEKAKISSDEIDDLVGIVKKYNLTSSELGLTKDQLKQMIDQAVDL